jgi:GAF domain-containing protein
VLEPQPNPFDKPLLGDDILAVWQNTVNLLARALGVPAGLVMRVHDDTIEVFVSSQSEGNPYGAGDSEHYVGSGLYCEWVVKNEDQLLIPNALEHPDWDANPDIKLGMVSYLGFPIRRPDGGVFGTLCVLDGQTNDWSPVFVELVQQMRGLLESHLRIVHDAARLREKDAEIEGLRSLLPICGHCKSIRKEDDSWVPIESYLIHTAKERPTHSICPPCLDRHYAEFAD